MRWAWAIRSGCALATAHRVTAADEQVAGVEAQPDAAAGEHPVGLLARLDHGADVRVQRGGEAASGGSLLEPVEVAQQRLPAGVVEHGTGVVALLPGRGGEHDGRGARRDEALHRPLDLGERVVARVVQHHGDELPDGLEPLRGEEVGLGLRGRRGGSHRDRTRWRPGRPRAIWASTVLGVVLPAPAGDLAHPPRDGGTGNAHFDRRNGGAHRVSISSRRTTRPSRRDSSQASAMRNACSASSTVQGEGRSPRATSAKAVSSAR